MHYTPTPFYSEYRPAKTYTLTLQGEGSVQVKPDIVIVTIGAATENNSVKAAQEENAMVSSNLLQALKALGIPENNIQTLSYTITPQYDYVEGKSILRGYRVEHLYEITVLNIQKAGEVYAAAVQEGANIARDLTFHISNPNIHYQQALTLAVQNAQEKAKTIATVLGVTLNPIPISITEASAHTPPTHAAYMTTQATAPPIQPGQITITVTIQAIFAYM